MHNSIMGTLNLHNQLLLEKKYLMLTCTILPHFRLAAIAVALLPLPPPAKATLVVGAPFLSGSQPTLT